jgi:stage V sporulation protein G
MQGAVLKAYQEERERAKQPGYVCTYDEYDPGDVDDSYTALIGELNPTGRKEGYRTHAAHGPRGSHGNQGLGQQTQTSVAAQEERRKDNGSFGAGIL